MLEITIFLKKKQVGVRNLVWKVPLTASPTAILRLHICKDLIILNTAKSHSPKKKYVTKLLLINK
ncbi:hypothetical protein EJD97_010097 [Solanum chilense]|uniref:Uncharacterized protein n=1 Tax=Solanum chilense TaxID=4083 RepID=A0A6N2BIJ8_SOLCI|nr:hypothetical protein EJD97_010097 [Solanum chilense]